MNSEHCDCFDHLSEQERDIDCRTSLFCIIENHFAQAIAKCEHPKYAFILISYRLVRSEKCATSKDSIEDFFVQLNNAQQIFKESIRELISHFTS